MTGVTGKLGSYVSDLVGKKELFLSIWQEVQSGQQSTRQRRLNNEDGYANTPEVVEALKGYRCLY